MNYCSDCGKKVEFIIPEDDDRHRYVCNSCGKVHYQNPRVVVGCIPVQDNKVLLCKRGIKPALHKWTIPAGFMENNETVEEGALRETREEIGLDLKIQRLHSVYSIPVVSQVYIIFVAGLDDLEPGITPECLEFGLFDENKVPWQDIAFSSVRFALKKYFEDIKTGNTTPHLGYLDV